MGSPILTKTRPSRVKYTLFGQMVAGFRKILARLVSGVIVQSQQMRRKAGLPRSSVIPCGVDFNLFEPTNRLQARDALGLSPSRRYILFPAAPAILVKNFPLAEAVCNLVK